ncbi:hypothetical protein CEXT_482371 [Caerostris extrusa]|uniref:Uncharacterized protein n=1 Tax=Caerostris extrusa TaxID=172846 RepID=A0AAV4UVD1_CAEEX|nr:hypothetical protein CEXT_482371 [Caerostris extrusa]
MIMDNLLDTIKEISDILSVMEDIVGATSVVEDTVSEVAEIAANEEENFTGVLFQGIENMPEIKQLMLNDKPLQYMEAYRKALAAVHAENCKPLSRIKICPGSTTKRQVIRIRLQYMEANRKTLTAAEGAHAEKCRPLSRIKICPGSTTER